jgi:hypothetical protein
MTIEFVDGPEDGMTKEFKSPKPIYVVLYAHRVEYYQLILFLDPLTSNTTPKYVWINSYTKKPLIT